MSVNQSMLDVGVACGALRLSRSGFCAWRDRERPKRSIENAELLAKLVRLQSTRTVTPKRTGRVRFMGRVGQHECVTGLCHLRGEIRNFNIMRIRDLTVAE